MWVINFADLKAICSQWIKILDHPHLNEIDELEKPTCENITIWLWHIA